MKKNQKNRVGIKDIAERANVSIGTVDRVLHNRGEVSEATRKQILQIVEEFNYTPNILAKSLSSKRNYNIAVLIPDSQNNNAYWEKPLIGIHAATKEIEAHNFNIIIRTFDFDNEKAFLKNAKEIIDLKPDGLIFAPVYLNSSTEIIEQCNKHSIPYIFFDVYINNCQNLAFFGQDSERSGYIAAKLMNQGLEKKSEIIILKLLQNNSSLYHMDLREQGFLAYFSSTEKNHEQNVRSYYLEVSSTSKMNTSLNEILHTSENIKGIFVPSSRVFLIANYLYNNKITDKMVIGYDLLQQNIEFLNKNIIHYLISQNPEEQGYKSVISLFNHLLLKKEIEKVNYSPIDIILKENIEYYKSFKI